MAESQEPRYKTNYRDLLKYQRELRDYISDHRELSARVEKLNECFLQFGSNPDENINRLVAFCGELMNASCAVYSRLKGRQLCSLGCWNVPPDFNPVFEAEGIPCYDVIRLGSEDPVVIPNLQHTIYAKTAPSVVPYNLQTYIGIAVKWNKASVGSLCVLYQSEVEPRAEDLHLMNIVGAAIGVEEERKRAEETLQDALSEVERLKNRLQQENIYLQEELKTEYNFEEIVGKSESLQKVLRKVEQVAPTDATVLIQGESGTGKELIAHAIHSLSQRKEHPLVKVNCGAISSGLVESELFGHEKGAFTGAVQRRVGRFELADGGTIFLDEVGELPLETQVKLLRVLQHGEFERVGSSQTLKVNVRVIAATNRDLKKSVQEGDFRQDLYYRLNVFPIFIPPLRERKEDIELLVRYFTKKYSRKLGKKIEMISQETMDVLTSYHWLGNIRELENVIERAVILTPGSSLKIDDCLDARPDTGMDSDSKKMGDMERSHIIRTLEETNWIIDGKPGAASILGMNPGTLRSRMKKLGIKRPQPNN